MTTLFVNQLTTLDFSFLCPKRGLVGETWLVDMALNGNLNDQGMVFDFGQVKKQLKVALDQMADHRLLVPTAHPSIQVTTTAERVAITLQSDQVPWLHYQAPSQAVFLVAVPAITPTALQPILAQALLRGLPDNITQVALTLYPQAIAGAYYHYSHGLKKHQGHCQRLAHGHRSAIQITVDDQRDTVLENQWATLWQDRYIATQADRLDTIQRNGKPYYRFGYTAAQGYFELTLAAAHCYLIDTDSTVELLAEHIAQTLAPQRPGQMIRVTAYEGFNKGASATCRAEK